VINQFPSGSAVKYTLPQAYVNNFDYVLDSFLADSKASDPDTDDTVSIKSVNINNCVGKVSVSNNVITYTPGSMTYAGTCVLQVTITDNDSYNPLTTIVPLTIVVTSPRTSPQATDDYKTVDQKAGVLSIPVSDLLSNDLAPISTTISFDKLLTCTTGFCNYKAPTYNPTTQSISLLIDPMSCKQDKFQYQIKTNDVWAATANATVYISIINCYCTSKLDIYFVLDNSGSIGNTNWLLMRQFTKNITDSLDISANGVNVGIVDFGYDGYSLLRLSSDRNTVAKTLLNMKYRGENTNTKAGLYAAVGDITGVFPNNQSSTGKTPTGRPGVTKVLLLITDGLPNTPVLSATRNQWGSYDKYKWANCDVLYGTKNAYANCTQGYFADQLQGVDPINCQNYYSNLPCSDPTYYTSQIQSWTSWDKSAYGTNFPKWNMIAMGIGDALNDNFGKSMLAQMNADHDPNNLILVGWDSLQSAVGKLTDSACNN